MPIFAKIWTDIENDEWYQGLKCIERGVWYQLIVLAKNRGKTGEISFRSHRLLAETMALDRGTCTKILRKFHRDKKIVLTEMDNYCIRIKLVNFIYHQELRGTKKDKRSGEKPTENRHYSRAEQSISEHTLTRGRAGARARDEKENKKVIIEKPKQEKSLKTEIDQLLVYYNKKMSGIGERSFCRDMLTPNEIEMIRDCLTIHPLENLQAAVDGCINDDYHQRNKLYSIKTIFKPESVSRYVALGQGFKSESDEPTPEQEAEREYWRKYLERNFGG